MDVFTALAVPTRREIIEMLAHRGRLSATDIYHKFHSSPPAISQHLKVLREAQLVIVEKKGQQRIYQLNLEKVYEFERWTQKMTGLWNERFDALDKLLEAEKKLLKVKGRAGRA
jgi:DNA-binding transcriptional ArsR family regulator